MEESRGELGGRKRGVGDAVPQGPWELFGRVCVCVCALREGEGREISQHSHITNPPLTETDRDAYTHMNHTHTPLSWPDDG